MTRTDVPPELLRRHLGVPVDGPLPERVESLIERTWAWYAEHGTPWTATCEVALPSIDEDSVRLESGARLVSETLARGLREAGAHALVVLAATAGYEVDAAVHRHWVEGRPDEAMSLSALAIAVVEHLRDVAATELEGHAARRQMTLLPRFSPGYEGWDVADQAVLYELIAATEGFRLHAAPPLELLAGGGLRPAKSTLTTYGLTDGGNLSIGFCVADEARAPTGSPVPASRPREAVSTGCATIARPSDDYWLRISAMIAGDPMAPSSTKPRDAPPRYAFPEKALQKWSSKRLSIDTLPDDRLSAKFHFDGSTCTNMGIPFAFDLSIVLKGESDGTRSIEACTAVPTAGDRGHRAMCGYLDGADSFLATISTFKLPVGRTLDEMVEWAPDTSPAGCVCTPTSMNHKWQIALQTLHFALRNGELG